MQETCLGSIPGLGRSPRGRHGNPLQYSCLENSMDKGSWWTIVHGVSESDMTERLCTLTPPGREGRTEGLLMNFLLFLETPHPTATLWTVLHRHISDMCVCMYGGGRGFLPPINNSSPPAGYPTVQLNSDTVHSEIDRLRARSRLPFSTQTCGASPKFRLSPGLLTNWL